MKKVSALWIFVEYFIVLIVAAIIVEIFKDLEIFQVLVYFIFIKVIEINCRLEKEK